MERPHGLVLLPVARAGATAGACVAENGLPHCDGTADSFFRNAATEARGSRVEGGNGPHSPDAPMPLWKQILLCLVVVILAAGGWYAFQHRDSLGDGAGGRSASAAAGGGRPGGGGPTLVVTEAVSSEVESDQVRSVGTVKVPRSINIYPQVSAVVNEVLFKAGDKVSKDQPLVRLDDADQRVALDLANIALKDARAALDRAQKLSASRNLALSALEDAQSVERKAQIAVLGAQIALDRRTITAPFEGVVGLSDLAVGDFVTSSTVVTTLDDVSTLLVSFLVPERYAGRVVEGLAVTATAASKPDATISGKVTSIDTRIDPTARTLKVEAVARRGSRQCRRRQAGHVGRRLARLRRREAHGHLGPVDPVGPGRFLYLDGRRRRRKAPADHRAGAPERARARLGRAEGGRQGRRRGPAAAARGLEGG